MDVALPPTLKVEHKQLHHTLLKATQESGEIGVAAREVARLLHPHFVKEETFALPPLGLLGELAHGPVRKEMGQILKLTRRLEAEHPLRRSPARAGALSTSNSRATSRSTRSQKNKCSTRPRSSWVSTSRSASSKDLRNSRRDVPLRSPRCRNASHASDAPRCELPRAFQDFVPAFAQALDRDIDVIGPIATGERLHA
jgi:hypothetical protein